MATHTSRYNLSKPENTDEMQSFMSDYADNMDKIDENLGGGGGSANIVELTQAEYDALPDSKLSDDTMYLIKDAISASDAEFTNVNGFFIDVNNVITSGSYSSALSYTATEDCYVRVAIAESASSSSKAYIDGKQIFGTWNGTNGIYTESPIFPLKKGQTLTVEASNASSSAYVVYGVQAGSNVTIIPDYASACYSTQEREVGCWTDGKPLYQKTINVANIGNVGTSGVVAISTNDIPFDMLRVVNANIYSNSMNRRLDLPNLSGYSPDRLLYHEYLDKSSTPVAFSFVLYSNGSTFSNLSDLNVTIQYTKTTDVAGSGNWTPLGECTHHYSTEEQVIGTWVDGKPVYEKTQVGGITFNGSAWQDTNIINVKDVISVEGVVLRDGEPIALGDFNNSLTTSWICRDNTIKVCVQSNTYGDPVQFKSITVRYTKTTD